MSQKPSQDTLCGESYENETCEIFLMRFSRENDHHIKTKALYSFTQAYLSHYKPDSFSLDFDAFLRLLSEVPSLCEFFLIAVNPQNKSVSTLEDKTKNLECACLCFDIIQKCLEVFCIIRHELVTTKIALSVLAVGYTHCKNSEMIYGDLFEQFVDNLGCFFKKIESLQMVLLNKLNKLNDAKCCEDESYLISIMEGIGNLCQLVSEMDDDAAVDLWNIYTKILYDHSNLQQCLDIYSVLICLATKCLELLKSLKCNLDKDSEEDLESSNKFEFYFIAFSTILNHIQDSVKGNCSQFKKLLINLLEFLTLCFSPFAFEKPSLNNIKSFLVRKTYCLISSLYSIEDFWKSMFMTEQKQNTLNPEVEQSYAATMLSKLCALPFMNSASMEHKQEFFLKIMSKSSNKDLDNNLLYLKIPQCAVTDTDSEELLTFYEFAYKQITDFLKWFPDPVVEDLNNKVLVLALENSEVVSILLYDVWIYRLRCSDIIFFRNQLRSTLHLYSSSEISVGKAKFKSFIKRMLTFMPYADKVMFSEEFSTLTFLSGDDEKIQHQYGIPDLTSSDYEFPVSSDEMIEKIMTQLSKCQGNDPLQLVHRASLCLELCTSFMDVSGITDILQFLEFAGKLFKTDVYEVQISVLTFLKALSKKQLAEHSSEFGKIIVCVAQLFSEAIHSKNYIVRLEALNTFTHFAKCTPHVRFVQETVRRDPSLKPLIKSYISAVPDNGYLSEKEKLENIQKCVSMSYDVQLDISQSSKQSLQQIFHKQ